MRVVSYYLEKIMADGPVKKFEFTVLDVQWLRKSLEFQRAGLERSRAKETVGGEIYALRTREIEMLRDLLNRVG